MTKIQSTRFKLAPVSQTYSLETSVSRVDIDRRQIGSQFHKFLLILQQNHVGGHTITGWPTGVQFIGDSQPNPVPGSQTVYQWFTNDGGANWAVEVNQLGIPRAIQATDVEVDDSQFSIVTGADLQTVLNSIDQAIEQVDSGGVGSGLPEAGVENQNTVIGRTTGEWRSIQITPQLTDFDPVAVETEEADGTSILGITTGNRFFGLPVAWYYSVGENLLNLNIGTNIFELRSSTGSLHVTETYVGLYKAGTVPDSWTSHPGFWISPNNRPCVSELTIGGVFGTNPSSTRPRLVQDLANTNSLGLFGSNGVFSVYQSTSSSNANYRRLRSFWLSTTLAAISAEAIGSLASSNVSIAIAPLGTGGFQLATTGDTRGIYSLDLQLHRALVSHIAAGPYSAILAGRNNRTAGQYSFAIGSFGATVTGNFSGIIGNQQNPELIGVNTVLINNHTSANITAEYSTIINNNFTAPKHRYSTVLCAPYDATGFDYGYGLINLQHRYMARMRCTGLLRIPEETDVLSAPFTFTTGVSIIPQALFITLYLQFTVLQVTDFSDPENPVIFEGTLSQIRTYIGTYNTDGSVTFGAAASVQGHTEPTAYFDVTFTSSTNSSPITGINGLRVLSLTGNIIDPGFIGTINCQAVLEAVYRPG